MNELIQDKVTFECRSTKMKGVAQIYSFPLFSYWGKRPNNQHPGREQIIVHEHTSHPSNIKKLTPYGFVVDSSQITLNRYPTSCFWKLIMVSNQLLKKSYELHIISRFFGWMNERCAHIRQFPLSVLDGCFLSTPTSHIIWNMQSS